MKPFTYLLAAIICATAQQVHADSVPPLNKGWNGMLEVPGYQVFYGKTDAVSIKPYVGIIWNKIVFSDPQKSAAGIYQTEVLEIQFRCQTHDATVLRRLHYTIDGALTSDESTDEKEIKYFDVKHHTNLDRHEAMIQNIASIDYEAACEKGD
ncbi:MAG: hypothetical protein ACRETO_09590 [Gammaproteobacteria bacterium]